MIRTQTTSFIDEPEMRRHAQREAKGSTVAIKYPEARIE